MSLSGDSPNLRRAFFEAPQLKRQRHVLVVLCFAAVVVCYLDRVNISVAALAMQEGLHWSETTKGLVLSSFFVGYLLFQVPAGYLANRFGGRRILGFAVLWWSLFTILTPWAATASLPMLLAVRVGMGLGEGAMFPAAYNLFANWVPQNERARSVSILMSGIPIGALCALFTSGALIARLGWPAVFYVFGALGLIWAAVWFVHIPQVAPHAKVQAVTARSIPWKGLLSRPAIWALVINHFCSNWTLYMLLAWLPSYFSHTQGLTLLGTGLYSAGPWLVLLVLINAGAWLADGLSRRGLLLTAVRKIMQTLGLIGSAVFLLVAQKAGTASSALVVMCGALGFLGFTWSGFLPNHLDIAPRHADVLMGITNSVATLPGIIGVAVTGWLVDVSGTYTSAFALAAALNVFGGLVWASFATAKQIFDDA